jgi:hypothetical protein
MRRRTTTLLALACVALIAAGLWLAWRSAQRAVAAATKPHEETVDMTSLVVRVRELNRLETASMRVMQVATVTQSYEYLPNAVAGDELTLLGVGDVIAGVDLSRIQRGDVWRDPDGTIVLRLPRAEVLVTRLDNRETHVLTRKTGMLRRSDIGLEGRARQHAEIAIRTEAVRRGILRTADQNAQTKLATFLHTLGFRRVRFVEEQGRAGG